MTLGQVFTSLLGASVNRGWLHVLPPSIVRSETLTLSAQKAAWSAIRVMDAFGMLNPWGWPQMPLGDTAKQERTLCVRRSLSSFVLTRKMSAMQTGGEAFITKVCGGHGDSQEPGSQ